MEIVMTPFSHLENLTGKHKDWFSFEFIKVFCSQLNPNNKLFKNDQFCKKYKSKYLKLELKERLNLIADLLDQNLELDYKSTLKLFESILGAPLPFEEGMFRIYYYLYPISQYVEKFGDRDLVRTLDFLEKLTMRFTGEWAIRPLANIDEKIVLKKVKEWTKHKNFHVRRLASEGVRPRLPWGLKIGWVSENPKKIIPLYNKLRNDDVLYVRRSVANSMGDIIKIDDDLAYSTFLSWLEKKNSLNNLWVIKHAIRTPVKKEISKYVKLKKEIELRMKELKS